MLKKKDLIILKLYFNFMNPDMIPDYFKVDDPNEINFLAGLYNFLNSNIQNGLDLCQILFPETCFKISKESRKVIKELLLQFQ